MPTNKPEVVLPEAPPIPAHLFDKDQSIVWAAAWETLRKHIADTLTRPADGDFVMVPREVVDRFPEINPSNYNHDDACTLNAWGVELVLSAAPQQHGQEEVGGWTREMLVDLRGRLVMSGISDHLDGGSNKASDRAYIKAAVTEAYGLIDDLLATPDPQPRQVADPVGTILRDVCELEPADPDKSDTVTVKFDDLHRILARNIVTQPQQPAEAVAVPVAFVPVHPRNGPLWTETYPMGSEAAERLPHYERMPLFFEPLPAIDIGKLRELVAELRESEDRAAADAANADEDRDAYAHDFEREAYKNCADQLDALIGDGGEKADGR